MNPFKILHINLTKQKSRIEYVSPDLAILGGSSLAAYLYQEYGLLSEPANHPDQPLIFCLGPLNGLFPMLSKVVLGFKSPYHQQYAETHAGGRLSLAMRFAGLTALVLTGKLSDLGVVEIAHNEINFYSTPFLKGLDVYSTGKIVRKISKLPSGKRSILRIGLAGENEVPISCINVDTYRHFGRLGAGAVMGSKNLKAIVIGGEANFDLESLVDLKKYTQLYRELYQVITQTKAVHKYHDLGTAQNIIPLNELKVLPWNNLQKTSNSKIRGISGEYFAQKLLLRKVACSGCPVGCIHIGVLREKFGQEHEYLYRQVSYDYELIFALGSMLGINRATYVLRLIEVVEKVGLDAMSAGVILAYVTEGLAKKIFTLKQTLVNLEFGRPGPYEEAIFYLAHPPNEFWNTVNKGLRYAIKRLGGEDFACLLGQEMAGYATGENYFVSQALGFRHSHLDTGAYSFDQKSKQNDLDKALDFLRTEENYRVVFTSCVGCLFARKAYSWEVIRDTLAVVGLDFSLQELKQAGAKIAGLRWQLKLKTGFDPAMVKIPKRFLEVETFKGKINPTYLKQLQQSYAKYIQELAASV